MSITLRQTDEGDRYDSEQRKYILKRERNESQSEVEGPTQSSRVRVCNDRFSHEPPLDHPKSISKNMKKFDEKSEGILKETKSDEDSNDVSLNTSQDSRQCPHPAQ